MSDDLVRPVLDRARILSIGGKRAIARRRSTKNCRPQARYLALLPSRLVAVVPQVRATAGYYSPREIRSQSRGDPTWLDGLEAAIILPGNLGARGSYPRAVILYIGMKRGSGRGSGYS